MGCHSAPDRAVWLPGRPCFGPSEVLPERGVLLHLCVVELSVFLSFFKVRKSLQETVRSFKVTNEELAVKGPNSLQDLAACHAACKVTGFHMQGGLGQGGQKRLQN